MHISTNPGQGELGRIAVRRAIQGMLEELEPNLHEHVLRRLVDHGHTFSPMVRPTHGQRAKNKYKGCAPQFEMAALQSASPLLHGEAVAIDMAIVTELAHGRGLLSASSVQKCYDVLHGFQLPLWHDSITDDLLCKARHCCMNIACTSMRRNKSHGTIATFRGCMTPPSHVTACCASPCPLPLAQPRLWTTCVGRRLPRQPALCGCGTCSRVPSTTWCLQQGLVCACPGACWHQGKQNNETTSLLRIWNDCLCPMMIV